MCFSRILVTGVLAGLLAACVTQPPALPPGEVPQVDRFELSGRVAVKLDGRGHSARLRWRHLSDSDSIWLYSPVGSTIATLHANGELATLVTSKQETYQSTNVQLLTRDVLGWDLPLSGLKYWVLGRVDPEAPVEQIELDEQLRIRRLVQGGWDVEFASYQPDGTLPSAMVLRYEDLRLRLVVDRWNVASLEQ
ncbi:MAG: lipoprotein insertase outer membrane protein LolB [Burkholderiales bacterium]